MENANAYSHLTLEERRITSDIAIRTLGKAPDALPAAREELILHSD